MKKKNFLLSFCLLILLFIAFGCNRKMSTATNKTTEQRVAVWLTNADKSALFEQQSDLSFSNATSQNNEIRIDQDQTYQTMDGFGFCLTGGSAYLIHKMNTDKRMQLLKELFGTDGKNIGISYLRVSIGASDLDSQVFSYDDLPPGETDVNMEKFSLAPDRPNLIPVLKEILSINPQIKILGSPWSPPMWMKTNDSSKGGSLKPEYYDAYAKYFVKYIEGMRKEGIHIDAITIQNEPLHPGNNPSMFMPANEQAAFIKQSLGPAFKAANIQTKIIVYDHNADRPDYPLEIYKDAEASKYVDGAAFHLYGGSIDALTQVHNAYPDKNLYFTEQWIGAPGNFAKDLDWHTTTLIIGAPRNWCKTVLEWNLASDPELQIHTPGGCTECLGAITIDGNNVTRNPAYYIVAHASKFVRPGSVRIASNMPEHLPNVAYKTPQGKTVLIVHNSSEAIQNFTINDNGKKVKTSLDAGAVATYVW